MGKIFWRAFLNSLTVHWYNILAKVCDNQHLTCREQIVPVQHRKYHGCWCPGSLRRQDISTHDIGYVEYMWSCLTSGGISTTCAMSVWRNDINCKCIFMYLWKIQYVRAKLHSYTDYLWEVCHCRLLPVLDLPCTNTVETFYNTIYYSKYFIELNFDKSTQYVALWTHKSIACTDVWQYF